MNNPPNPDLPPMHPPQSSEPGAPKAGAADEDPTIFEGPVSQWLGFRAYFAGGLLGLLGLAGAVWGAKENQPWLWVPGLALAVACGLMAAYTAASIKSRRYKITRRLIEREQGLLVKRVDSLDLGRVKDVQLKQTLWDRMLNVGTIEVFSSDKLDPDLLIEAIPNPRPVYEKLRDAVIEVSRKRGVIPM
ncbi:MAG: PH domain-containing protein [Planctomycetota bacterium]